MSDARTTLDNQFLEMRWRLLSLAADFDRIQLLPGGPQLLASDSRIALLRQAMQLLQSNSPNRAEQLQMIFSDESRPADNHPSKIKNQK